MCCQRLGAALPAQSEFLLPIKKGTTLKVKNAPTSQQLPLTQTRKNCPAIRAVSIDELPPNALRRKRDSSWRGGFSVGVDLGLSRTGLALSKGFSVRPLTVIFPPIRSPCNSFYSLRNIKDLVFDSVGVEFERAKA